jgi:hypothetical protein
LRLFLWLELHDVSGVQLLEGNVANLAVVKEVLAALDQDEAESLAADEPLNGPLHVAGSPHL